jgi:hypothetical protein
MSDYNNPNSYDKYGNPIPGEPRPFSYEPVEGSGRAPYVLLGILVLLGIVGGGLYFNSSHRGASDVAAAPPAMEQPAPAPGPMGTMNTTPAPTTTSPAGAPSTTDQK